MAGFLSSPKPAPVVLPPPAPTRDDASIQAEADAQAAARAQAAGRAATIQTSGQGDTSTPKLERKTLLGAAA